jgi:hypothetical protein
MARLPLISLLRTSTAKPFVCSSCGVSLTVREPWWGRWAAAGLAEGLALGGVLFALLFASWWPIAAAYVAAVATWMLTKMTGNVVTVTPMEIAKARRRRLLLRIVITLVGLWLIIRIMTIVSAL